jgi:hypothetical protein
MLFILLMVSCDTYNQKPDYIAFSNVEEIRLSGLTEKEEIEFNIGYWETNNYNTHQLFKTYTADIEEAFSPGIDITYIAFEEYYNPPKYQFPSQFINNVLTIEVSYFEDETE